MSDGLSTLDLVYQGYGLSTYLRALNTHLPVLPLPVLAPRAVIIGEAPGATEVATGIPFTGKAGQRLRSRLQDAGLRDEECWITNVLKLRPTNTIGRDRPPRVQEIGESMPYLWRELAMGPGHHTRLICALGRTAVSALLGSDIRISDVHGQWVKRAIEDPAGEKWMVFASYHPAAALRSPEIDAMFTADLADFARDVRESGQEALEKLRSG